MSIYGHLSKFNPKLTYRYEEETKKYKKSNLAVIFKKNEFTVKKGDKIGEIGNSGFSFGPHLHYEIRNLINNKLVNPLFFGVRLKDCSAPIWKKIKLFQTDENRISRSEKIIYLNDNQYFNIDTIEWYSGKTGLAAQVFDVMEGNNNKNGVYQLKMFVNGQLHFHFSANKIPLLDTRYANAMIDYKENKKSNDIFYRCFRLPGYVPGSYTYYLKDGYFDIKQDQITNIEIQNKMKKIKTVYSELSDEKTKLCEKNKRFLEMINNEKIKNSSLTDKLNDMTELYESLLNTTY
jgi:hypothetical protein